MKQFLIIGNTQAITYKEIFPLIKENKLWLGFGFSGGNAYFTTPNVCEYAKGVYNAETGLVKFRNCHWFTNLEHDKRHRPLDLYKHYSNEYKHYDNYDAIEVGKVCDIPMDYEGVMGVPITFLDKYCPEQFEIVKFRKGDDDKDLSVNGVCPYFRILIRHRKAQLMEYGKKFIIVGNTQAITYKEVFPFIKNNELWLGASSFNCGMYFQVPDNYEYAKTYKFDRERNGVKVMRVSSICWFTNLDHAKRNKPIDLYKHYSNEYKHYDNYDAIEVGKVCEIPMDYDGVMGVPITFLDKYCPEQFEILGCSYQYGDCGVHYDNTPWGVFIDGKDIYKRLFIRHRK